MTKLVCKKFEKDILKKDVFPFGIFSSQMSTIYGRALNHMSHMIMYLLKKRNFHSRRKTYRFAI